MEFDPTFLCYKCREPFKDEIDWEIRHSDESGEDIHAECCDLCRLPETKKKGPMTNCFKCDIELVPDGPPNRETNYQFDNALWIGFFGGYGMFVDNMMDFDEATSPPRILKDADYEAVLCHECAHWFMDSNPWLKELFHPLNTHSHKTAYVEGHPDHQGWDTLWHDVEKEYLASLPVARKLIYEDQVIIRELMDAKIRVIKEKEGA